MKLTPLLAALTAINLALGVFNLVAARPSQAAAPPGMIRGTGLQIVDSHGKVRASISVVPEDKDTVYPDGRKGYPETVLLRLIDPRGRPSVKIQSTELGGGLALSAGRNDSYAQLGPIEGVPRLVFTDQDGRRKVIEP
jgi:hypothetical protein